jgi:integrase
MNPFKSVSQAECCEICGRPLSVDRCWRSSSSFYCSDLQASLDRTPRLGQRILAGRYRCSGIGCGKAIPAGNYRFRKKALFCSSECSLQPTGRLLRRRFAAGEVSCLICGDPLPESWLPRNKKYFFCTKPECQALSKTPLRRFVREGELPCEAPGCKKSARCGWNAVRKKHFFCSDRCWRRFSQMVTYRAGEKKCEICGKRLGRIRCWRGKKRFFCGKASCSYRSPQNRNFPIQRIKEGEKHCARPGCPKMVPAGSYMPWKKLFFCSRRCKSRYQQKLGKREVKCSYCGKMLKRARSSRAKQFFCSEKEKGAYKREKLDRDRCGPFLGLYQKYVEEFVEVHYRDPKCARSEARQFFRFLCSEGVQDINSVIPSHISGFLRQRKKTVQSPRADYVKTMFDWLAENGIFDHSNPVRPRIHYTPIPKSEPRPYSREGMRFIWRLLRMRGDTRSRAIIAIGEEAGLRGMEVIRIRRGDVSLKQQTIYVRDPKNRRAVTVCFGKKTNEYLELWLKERPECDHDFLFTNKYGDRLSREALGSLLNRVLCKRARGRREVYEIGLDKFDFHRLRHTNSTNLRRGGMSLVANMRQHNWKNPRAALGYMEISSEEQAEEYHNAMARITAAKDRPPEAHVISMDEYLASCRKEES